MLLRAVGAGRSALRDRDRRGGRFGAGRSSRRGLGAEKPAGPAAGFGAGIAPPRRTRSRTADRRGAQSRLLGRAVFLPDRYRPGIPNRPRLSSPPSRVRSIMSPKSRSSDRSASRSSFRAAPKRRKQRPRNCRCVPANRPAPSRSSRPRRRCSPRSDMPATRSRKSSTGGSSSTMKRAQWRSPMCSTPDRRCASARRRSAVSNGSTRPMSSGASGGARARSTTPARSRRRGGRWSIPGCSAPSRSSRSAIRPIPARSRCGSRRSSGRTARSGSAPPTIPARGSFARLFWENRNLFGQAEYLHASIEAGTQKLGVAGTFRRPDFLAIDQDLVARAEVARENPVAYDSRYARLSVGLERRFLPGLTVGGAVSVEKANVDQKANIAPVTSSERSQHYALIGLPLFAKLDRSDDLLNPTSGYRLQGNLVPYQSFSGPDLTFVNERVAGSIYRRLGGSDRYIVAGVRRRLVDPGRLASRTAGRQADLCRRRRFGPGLRLSDGRAARCQQQPDRRHGRASN